MWAIKGGSADAKNLLQKKNSQVMWRLRSVLIQVMETSGVS